jgi:hypothetical protein
MTVCLFWELDHSMRLDKEICSWLILLGYCIQENWNMKHAIPLNHNRIFYFQINVIHVLWNQKSKDDNICFSCSFSADLHRYYMLLINGKYVKLYIYVYYFMISVYNDIWSTMFKCRWFFWLLGLSLFY